LFTALGFTAGTLVQADPFHRLIQVDVTPLPGYEKPTAQACDSEVASMSVIEFA
jgi:hypothetical protein